MFEVKEFFRRESSVSQGLLKSVLGYVDTAHYTYGELTNEINAETGGIMCGVEVFDHAESIDEFQAFSLYAERPCIQRQMYSLK